MADPKIVKDWLNAADEDYGFACSNLNDTATTYFGFICFHFQQAAEKYLKTYIVAKGLRFEKIHDLDTLRKICEENELSFSKIVEECIYLSDFYLETRYPPTIPSELSRIEAERAKLAVETVADLVKSLLL